MPRRRPPVVVGQVYRARTGSGRLWRVDRAAQGREGVASWILAPLGGDVSSARSARTGKWQGGVRSINVPDERLRDARYWSMISGP